MSTRMPKNLSGCPNGKGMYSSEQGKQTSLDMVTPNGPEPVAAFMLQESQSCLNDLEKNGTITRTIQRTYQAFQNKNL